MFKGDVKGETQGEMFIIYNGKDERDPHGFMLKDPYYINGLVKEWEIKELDLIHAERDDELVIRDKFR
jgi:uncharacterized protein YciI